MSSRINRLCPGLCILLTILIGSPCPGQTRTTEPNADERSAAGKPRTTSDSGDAIAPRTGQADDSLPRTTRIATAKTAPDASGAAVVCEPSQGRPIFRTPGDTFIFVMRVSDRVTGDVGFFLRHGKEPQIRVPLKPTTPPSFHEEYCTLILSIPPNTSPGLYDIEVRAAGGTFYSRNCVRMVDKFKDAFRFIHLSNMNIGDLSSPEFDDNLPREVNLLAPEFIVATGNFTEWSRARDDAASWQRVLRFFEKFDAPVFMLCGSHDHEASFARFVAKEPIGVIDYGNYHGLLLLDHPGNPIEQDYTQIQWIETDLKRNRQKRFNFICTNSDELGLLDVWRETGDLERIVKDYRIKLILSGGATDWDYREFAGKLEGLNGLHFVRTHQASTSLRDRATGISHYRVIEVDGDQIAYVYPDDNATEKLQHSIPAGRLRTFFDGPNDGSASRVVATVQNALNQSFADARLWLRVAKVGNEQPAVSPGRLIRVLDAGSYWACEAAVNLPDKGAVRVMAASSQQELPPAPPIAITLQGPEEWAFAPAQTDFGLSYFQSAAKPVLKLTNQSDSRQNVWPVISVNGQQIHPDRSVHPRMPISIEGGKTVELPLILQIRRLSPGPHLVQVYLLEDPLCRLTTFPLHLNSVQEVARGLDSEAP